MNSHQKSLKRLAELKNYNKSEAQAKAFKELCKRFGDIKNGISPDIYIRRKYGEVQPSLKFAEQYDTPMFLKDWSKDKRKVRINA